jgi:hypothetical protein
MFSRKLVAPLATVLMLVMGTQADAAKPVQTELLPITLPHITAVGEIDLVTEGSQAIALVELFYKKGGSRHRNRVTGRS